ALPALHAYALCCGVFFFQAEDGIRDFHVTGVQTCALPIYAPIETRPTDIAGDPRGHAVGEHRPVRGVGRAYDGATATGPRPRPPPEGARTPWRSPSACATSPARSRSTPR